MKTAVSLPDQLFHRAEQEAARRGVSRSALYAEALAQLLGTSDRPDPVTCALDLVYAGHEQEAADLGRSVAQGWIDDGSWTW